MKKYSTFIYIELINAFHQIYVCITFEDNIKVYKIQKR